MERRFITTDESLVQIEERANGTRSIVGYGAVFYDPTNRGTEYEMMEGLFERITPTAFDAALQRGDDVRGLYNHNPDHLLGRSGTGTMSLDVDDRGLRYVIPVDDNDADHQRVVRKIERGDLNGSSFAFVPESERFTRDDMTGRDVREILSVRLYDTGPVTFPAYSATSAQAPQALRSSEGLDDVLQRYNDWKRLDVQSQQYDAARVRMASLDV